MSAVRATQARLHVRAGAGQEAQAQQRDSGRGTYSGENPARRIHHTTAPPDSFEHQLDQRPRTRNSLELHNGQTSLFVGFSGDQDPWLLSKLYRDHDAPEESDINYDLKNPLNTSVPVIFSVCPTEYLNPRPDRYHVDTIKRVCLLPGHAQQDAVVDAARIHVHHLVAVPGESPAGCPQPGGRTDVPTVRFRAESAVAGAGRCHAADYPGAAAQGELAAAADPQRQRSPPLGAVGITRSHGTGAGPEPRAARMGHPAVGGAHAAPALVYVHDKWESFGLSRSSHIVDTEFRVDDLTETDFLEEHETELAHGSGVRVFIAMVRLTKVLADMLGSFYSVSQFLKWSRSPEEMLAAGVDLMNRANAVETIYLPTEFPSELIGCVASFQLAKTAVTLSCCRAVLYNNGDAGRVAVHERALQYAASFNGYLESIVKENQDVYWWSYSRVNFSIVGTCIMALYVMAIGKAEETGWRAEVEQYTRNLQTISKLSPVAHLALLRFSGLVKKTRNYEQGIRNSSEAGGSDQLSPGDGPLRYDLDWRGGSFPASFFNDDDIFLEWLASGPKE
ncbi:hypothetical protein KL948_004809 [Ogataea haglerorum]|nr:hypothetical protein KL948_004809 [Ogataea haglerorum]